MASGIEIDISLVWVEERSVLETGGFTLPQHTYYGSLSEALERACAPTLGSDARPWLDIDGVLFGPAQVEALCRAMEASGSGRMASAEAAG